MNHIHFTMWITLFCVSMTYSSEMDNHNSKHRFKTFLEDNSDEEYIKPKKNCCWNCLSCMLFCLCDLIIDCCNTAEIFITTKPEYRTAVLLNRGFRKMVEELEKE